MPTRMGARRKPLSEYVHFFGRALGASWSAVLTMSASLPKSGAVGTRPTVVCSGFVRRVRRARGAGAAAGGGGGANTVGASAGGGFAGGGGGGGAGSPGAGAAPSGGGAGSTGE